jgi:hypothetical protein
VPAGRSTPLPLRDDFANRGLVGAFEAEDDADRRELTPSGCQPKRRYQGSPVDLFC